MSAESNHDAAGLLGRTADRAERLRDRVSATADRDDVAVLLRRHEREAAEATRDAVSAVEQVEDVWAAGLRSIRNALLAGQPPAEQVALLREFAAYVDSARVLFPPVRRLWDAVGRYGGDSAGAGELDRAAGLLDRIHREVVRAIDARVNPWQPRDKERYEAAMRRRVEGNVTDLTAEDFKARMRRTPAEGAT